MKPRHVPTVEEGQAALHGHIVDKALAAREQYGPDVDAAAIERLLADTDVVRFPTRLVWDDADLLPGEFAWARPRGERPGDGYDLLVHPWFRDRPDVLPLLVAYHVPRINYLDVIGHEEAELFGAALLGLEVDAYYERLCVLTDELAEATGHAPVPVSPPSPASAGGSCCGGTSGCQGQSTKPDTSCGGAA